MSNSNENSVVISGEEYEPGPSLEESYEALKKEGIVTDEGEGVASEPNEGAQGGAEEGDAGQDSNEDRPDWLPSKFKTPEELSKAYEELQRKLSEGKQESSDDEQTDDSDDNSETETKVSEEEVKAVKDATDKAGLDLNVIQQEWYDEGGLKDETYEALEKAGYPRDMVDTYIDGLVARTGDVVMSGFEAAGGQEAYGEMIEWASQNLSDEEQQAFDKAVTSKDKNTVLMAIKALKADWQAAVSNDDTQEPEETVEASGAVKGNAYQSLDDYIADLSNPQYDQSETFRQKVAEKLARSDIM
ncbi:capsid assembly protein [Maritalea mediterranea]|uniref:Capsid assembly protein n=1 Tax=Maritalea mediterranea TaxID=2909667 RepID=A0ABS9EA84_9HYPH|nr:hypothetical protein [Maritalea mediterranea]MCF4099792.1 hypothetical protein [Maritalea mediterranea]